MWYRYSRMWYRYSRMWYRRHCFRIETSFHAVVNKVTKRWFFLTRWQTSNFSKKKKNCTGVPSTLPCIHKLCAAVSNNALFDVFLISVCKFQTDGCIMFMVGCYCIFTKKTLSYSTCRGLSSWHSFINTVNNDAGPLGCYSVSTKKMLLIKVLPRKLRHYDPLNLLKYIPVDTS